MFFVLSSRWAFQLHGLFHHLKGPTHQTEICIQAWLSKFFAEAVIVDYHLSLATKENKLPFSVSVCSSLPFPF
jgi:hypothetical protein